MVSEIWKHFEPFALEKKALCKHCKIKYAYNGSSTKNLWDHVRNKHAQFIPDQKNNEKKLTDQNEDASTSAQKEPPNKLRKMDQFVQKSKMELHPAEKIVCRMIIRQN